VKRADVNPDLIRREEQPYRSAVTIGDESVDE